MGGGTKESMGKFSYKYVCADCGLEGNEENGPCKRCRSLRIVLQSVAEEIFGKNWRDCFNEST